MPYNSDLLFIKEILAAKNSKIGTKMMESAQSKNKRILETETLQIPQSDLNHSANNTNEVISNDVSSIDSSVKEKD